MRDFDRLKCTEICFVAWHMVCTGECSFCTEEKRVLCRCWVECSLVFVRTGWFIVELQSSVSLLIFYGVFGPALSVEYWILHLLSLTDFSLQYCLVRRYRSLLPSNFTHPLLMWCSRWHLWNFLSFILRERERENMSRGGVRGRERIPRRLHAASDTGLELTNREIMTWTKIKRWTLIRLSHPGASWHLCTLCAHRQIYNYWSG